MENIFATERLNSLLPKVISFVEKELIPLEKDHHKRSWNETAKLLDQKREKVKDIERQG